MALAAPRCSETKFQVLTNEILILSCALTSQWVEKPMELLKGLSFNIFAPGWRFLMGVWHLDLIQIWLLVFDTPMFQILTLYLGFEGAKNIHVP